MEKIFDSNEKNKAILVSVISQNDDPHEKAVSLDELERLLDTAGGELFACVTQQRQTPDTKTFVGSGKIEEIKELCHNNGVDLVICDSELSPSQIRNLEGDIGEDVMVMDNDEQIKNNRLALLSAVKDVTHAVGDLNLIV